MEKEDQADKRRATLEQAEVACRGLGRLLGSVVPKGWGFTLILWSYGENGFSTYIANCAREDMIKALRETAEKLESRAPEA